MQATIKFGEGKLGERVTIARGKQKNYPIKGRANQGLEGWSQVIKK